MLKIATYNCGLFLGREEDFGSVRAGRFADLVMLNADPTVDIDNTEKIAFVMKAADRRSEAGAARRQGCDASGTAVGKAAMRIKGLHHNAYRCRDSEETRRFYEDFLGLPLVNAFEIKVTKTGRAAKVLHAFYAMADGSCLAFFEAPEQPFEFKRQDDFDLHIALEIPHADLEPWLSHQPR